MLNKFLTLDPSLISNLPTLRENKNGKVVRYFTRDIYNGVITLYRKDNNEEDYLSVQELLSNSNNYLNLAIYFKALKNAAIEQEVVEYQTHH